MEGNTKENQENLAHSLDSLLRPSDWNNYVGQEQIKNNLQILIKAAKDRGQMPEHILLHGTAGLGKTTLAHLVGGMLGLPIQTTSGAVVERTGDIVSLASMLEGGGVLFIDEIHRLNRNIEEVLYPIMETGSVDVIVGKGPTAKSVKISLPPIVVIAATTQIGKLSAPLRSRFGGGIMRLSQYNQEEIEQIIKQSANILNIEVTDSGVKAIANSSRNTPRIANYLLKRVRDYAQVNNKKIDEEIVVKALSDRSIDKFGLTEEDRILLMTIRDAFNGGPVGINALASTMGEDLSTIEEVYEPFLIQTGYLERTPRGRSLTQKGFEYLNSVE